MGQVAGRYCAVCGHPEAIAEHVNICRTCWAKARTDFDVKTVSNKAMFVMASEFVIPKDWWEPYAQNGWPEDTLSKIASEWREWWSIGPGEGRRKTQTGWKRCFQNRIAQLSNRGKV